MSDDKTARIWDASSGRCVQTLETGRALYDISLDANSRVLRTEIGPLHFNVLSGSELAAVTPGAVKAHDQALGLSDDNRWITVASEKVVWLPSEYRLSYSVVSGQVMGVCVGSGRVWIWSFSI
jgi:hypothetical protein